MYYSALADLTHGFAFCGAGRYRPLRGKFLPRGPIQLTAPYAFGANSDGSGGDLLSATLRRPTASLKTGCWPRGGMATQGTASPLTPGSNSGARPPNFSADRRPKRTALEDRAGRARRKERLRPGSNSVVAGSRRCLAGYARSVLNIDRKLAIAWSAGTLL